MFCTSTLHKSATSDGHPNPIAVWKVNLEGVQQVNLHCHPLTVYMGFTLIC